MNKYLIKIAEDLRWQQERALKKMDQNGGVILDHSMGSGKTLVFLTAAQRAQEKDPNGKVLIISPASTTRNIDREIKKYNIKLNRKNLNVMSYEQATRKADELKKDKYVLAVADEAQKLRNTNTKRHAELSQIIEGADRRLLATATPVYNKVSDIAPLVNIAAGGGHVLPEEHKAFEDDFVRYETIQAPFLKWVLLNAPPKQVSTLKNKKKLSDILNTYVDSYDTKNDPEELKHFPVVTHKVVQVPMSPIQHALYKDMEGKLPWPLRLKVRLNSTLTPSETAKLQAFSSGVRQASNDVTKFMPKYVEATPKIRTAVDSVQHGIKTDKNFKGIIYSNYLKSGVEAYAKELDKRKIPYVVFDGGMTKNQKYKALDDYNEGKVKIILVTSSGGEGLNTIGTKKVQILEPWFNNSKIDQVIGRASRYDSHAKLPKDQRQVEVERYESVFPNGIFGKPRTHSIDQYLSHSAVHKQSLTKQIQDLTRDQSKPPAAVKRQTVVVSKSKTSVSKPPKNAATTEKIKNVPKTQIQRD